MTDPAPVDADELLGGLTDEEWKAAHDAQYGEGSTIPDDQLGYVYEPGQSVEDLGGEDAVKARLT